MPLSFLGDVFAVRSLVSMRSALIVIFVCMPICVDSFSTIKSPIRDNLWQPHSCCFNLVNSFPSGGSSWSTSQAGTIQCLKERSGSSISKLQMVRSRAIEPDSTAYSGLPDIPSMEKIPLSRIFNSGREFLLQSRPFTHDQEEFFKWTAANEVQDFWNTLIARSVLASTDDDKTDGWDWQIITLQPVPIVNAKNQQKLGRQSRVYAIHDGLQRLVTIQLLLSAMHNTLRDKYEACAEELQELHQLMLPYSPRCKTKYVSRLAILSPNPQYNIESLWMHGESTRLLCQANSVANDPEKQLKLFNFSRGDAAWFQAHEFFEMQLYETTETKDDIWEMLDLVLSQIEVWIISLPPSKQPSDEHVAALVAKTPKSIQSVIDDNTQQQIVEFKKLVEAFSLLELEEPAQRLRKKLDSAAMTAGVNENETATKQKKRKKKEANPPVDEQQDISALDASDETTKIETKKKGSKKKIEVIGQVDETNAELPSSTVEELATSHEADQKAEKIELVLSKAAALEKVDSAEDNKTTDAAEAEIDLDVNGQVAVKKTSAGWHPAIDEGEGKGISTDVEQKVDTSMDVVDFAQEPLEVSDDIIKMNAELSADQTECDAGIVSESSKADNVDESKDASTLEAFDVTISTDEEEYDRDDDDDDEVIEFTAEQKSVLSEYFEAMTSFYGIPGDAEEENEKENLVSWDPEPVTNASSSGDDTKAEVTQEPLEIPDGIIKANAESSAGEHESDTGVVVEFGVANDLDESMDASALEALVGTISTKFEEALADDNKMIELIAEESNVLPQYVEAQNSFCGIPGDTDEEESEDDEEESLVSSDPERETDASSSGNDTKMADMDSFIECYTEGSSSGERIEIYRGLVDSAMQANYVESGKDGWEEAVSQLGPDAIESAFFDCADIVLNKRPGDKYSNTTIIEEFSASEICSGPYTNAIKDWVLPVARARRMLDTLHTEDSKDELARQASPAAVASFLFVRTVSDVYPELDVLLLYFAKELQIWKPPEFEKKLQRLERFALWMMMAKPPKAERQDRCRQALNWDFDPEKSAKLDPLELSHQEVLIVFASLHHGCFKSEIGENMARTILLRLNAYYDDKVIALTPQLERVLPSRLTKASPWSGNWNGTTAKSWRNRLGDLLLVDSPIPKQRPQWEHKQRAMAQSPYPLTRKMADQQLWDPQSAENYHHKVILDSAIAVWGLDGT